MTDAASSSEPTLTPFEAQVTRWQRPVSAQAWMDELATFGDTPPANPEQAADYVLFGVAAGLGLLALMTLVMPHISGWFSLVPAAAMAGSLRLALQARVRINGWKKDPTQVRLALIQEYRYVDSMAFRDESRSNTAMFNAYRAMRHSGVPILRGDVEHMRRTHGVQPLDAGWVVCGATATLVCFLGMFVLLAFR